MIFSLTGCETGVAILVIYLPNETHEIRYVVFSKPGIKGIFFITERVHMHVSTELMHRSFVQYIA